MGTVQNIKTIISGAIEGDSSKEQLLVKLCTDIAEAYLRTKVKKHSFLINIAAPSLRDFAIDCIAELFERKDHKLVVFQKWLPKEDIQQFTEGKVFIQLRRLVFSKVNDHIFGTYRNYDPSLSKIIRNIKRVLNQNCIEELEVSSDGTFVCLKTEKSDGIEIPVEVLLMKFSARFKEVSSTVEALQQLRIVFEVMGDEYTCRIHLTAFALILREFYTALQDEEVSSFEPVDRSYLNGELKSIIDNTVEQTKKELYSSYVPKNKIKVGDFSGYFMAVQQIIESEFSETKYSGYSFYDHFASFFNTINKEEYRNTHRKFLEYFVKLTKQNLLNYLKKENDSANRPFG